MNKELHKQFVKLGLERNKLTYSLLSLLPRIYEEKVYRSFCKTIEEYAGKYGGLSKRVVKKTLNLEVHLKDKPLLKEAIKEFGVHKVNIVARVATKETEKYWLEKVKTMSKDSLEGFVREYRTGKVGQSIRIRLSVKVAKKFLNLRSELDKNLSNEEALEKLLTELEEFRKGKSVSKPRGKRERKRTLEGKVISRNIPKIVKLNLSKICVYPECNELAEVYHHRIRFSEQKNHKSVVPLCKRHHEFAHNGLIKNELGAPSSWKLQMNGQLSHADELYHKYHMLR